MKQWATDPSSNSRERIKGGLKLAFCLNKALSPLLIITPLSPRVLAQRIKQSWVYCRWSSLLFSIFVPFGSSTDLVMPSHPLKGGLATWPSPQFKCQTHPKNPHRHTQYVWPHIWVQHGPDKLTQTINHQGQGDVAKLIILLPDRKKKIESSWK